MPGRHWLLNYWQQQHQQQHGNCGSYPSGLVPLAYRLGRNQRHWWERGMVDDQLDLLLSASASQSVHHRHWMCIVSRDLARLSSCPSLYNSHAQSNNDALSKQLLAKLQWVLCLGRSDFQFLSATSYRIIGFSSSSVFLLVVLFVISSSVPCTRLGWFYACQFSRAC